ncbi:pentatricopeptide repeat-containing protein [Tanacetum coccineum]|uniref:Pentatricopeptide repeat-containing protein n=1 Tax=Tanacetum coccineum TaxID=301880 RepID=A0ABQ5BSD6_9ASTR
MYVLLSNLYAASGRWADVGAMRLKMRDTGVKKVPGYSWLEVQNKIHTFSVGDSTHPETLRIYAYLEELGFRLKKEGYISSPKLVLHDVEEEEKEHMLRYHSEKLAVAFGILNIQAGRPRSSMDRDSNNNCYRNLKNQNLLLALRIWFSIYAYESPPLADTMDYLRCDHTLDCNEEGGEMKRKTLTDVTDINADTDRPSIETASTWTMVSSSIALVKPMPLYFKHAWYYNLIKLE